MLDCIIVGNIDCSIEARLSTCDATTQLCCRRQYLTYEGKKMSYPDFFTSLKFGQFNWEPSALYRSGQITLNEITSYTGSYLANYLLANNLQVEYLNYYDGEQEQYFSYLGSHRPVVVVLSLGIMFNSLPILRFVRATKKANPMSIIILSGQYIYNKCATASVAEFEETKKLIGADYYVTELPGEEQILDIIIRCSNGQPPTVTYSEASDGEETADWVFKDESMITPIMYLKTSVGCPAKCSFCNFPIKNMTLRYTGLEIVKKQLDQFERNNVETVIIMDDTFNIPINRFTELVRLIGRYPFSWYCYCRLKELDEASISLMSQNNCKGVFVGIESANDTILQNMNKSATSLDYRRSLDLLHKKSIMICAFLIVGFPGETIDTLNETIHFLNTSPIEYYTANLWYADVSTPIYLEKEKYKLTGKDFNWKHATMSSLSASLATDRLLLEVTAPTWVPNENFGFQGIPYLLQKGYSDAQVHLLLYNAQTLIKKQILGETVFDEHLLNSMASILNKRN